MKLYFLLLPGILFCTRSIAQADASQLQQLEQDAADYSYVMGRLHALDIYLNNLPLDRDALREGFASALAEDPSQLSPVELKAAMDTLDLRIEAYRAAAAQAHLEAGQAYLKERSAQPGVVVLASGVVLEALSPGDGAAPSYGERVDLTIHTQLVNGREVYPFRSIDGTLQFFLRERPPMTGLSEALTHMQPGARYRVCLPAETAYGAEGRPTVPPNATLILDVTLHAILP